MLGVLAAGFPHGRTVVLNGPALAAATPSPSPSTVSSDFGSALPSWLLAALLGVVTLVIVAAFALTAYSLSAPRSTLKNLLGRTKTRRSWNIWNLFGTRPPLQGPEPAPPNDELLREKVTDHLIAKLATSARSGKRTTRTVLAIVGFSLLGVVLIAIFGLSGQGVRDLRSQVVAAVTTLVATIAGFYFGAETARNQGSQAGPGGTAPVFKNDPKDPGFTVGQPGTYTPVLTGTPSPSVSLVHGTLPAGLRLDSHTGVISGTPGPSTAGPYALTLTAKNGISPDATLQVTLTVATPSAPTLQPGPGNPQFTVGQPGTYTPALTGSPQPIVSVSPALPAGLDLDSHTGVISGTPGPSTAGPYALTLTAKNGISPDATLQVTLTVST
jgi:Putative Ig domain